MNFLLRVLAVILVLAASQAKAWSMAPGGGTAYMGNDTGSGSRAQEPTVTSYGHDAIGNGIANAGKAIARPTRKASSTPRETTLPSRPHPGSATPSMGPILGQSI